MTFLTGNAFTLQILTLALLNAALTVALTTSFGFAGTFNLSQGSFYGIGAYTAAILLTDVGAPFGVALLGSILVSTAGGLIMGFVSVRLRDDYFAFASIAFTVIVTQAFIRYARDHSGRIRILRHPARIDLRLDHRLRGGLLRLGRHRFRGCLHRHPTGDHHILRAGDAGRQP